MIRMQLQQKRESRSLSFFIIDLASVDGVYSLAMTQSTFPPPYLSVPTIELGYGNKPASLSLSFPGNMFILLVSSSSLRGCRPLSLSLSRSRSLITRALTGHFSCWNPVHHIPVLESVKWVAKKRGHNVCLCCQWPRKWVRELFVQGMHKWKFLTPQRKAVPLCGQTRESPGSPEEADMLSATGQRTQSLKQQEHTYTHLPCTHTHTHTYMV